MDRPNLALVVLDTLRKDTFDEYFGWLPGVQFENAYAPGDFTTPTHGSLFTGLYPSEHGAKAKSKHLDAGPTLAELLRERGYRTRAFSANPNVSPEYGFVDGFDEYRAAWQYDDFADVFDWHAYARERGDRSGPLRDVGAVWRCLVDDCRTARSLRHGLSTKFGVPDPTPEDKGARSAVDALDRLDFSRRGEFLFVNLMEMHTPYRAPDGYLPGGPVEKPPIVAQLSDGVSHGTRLRDAYEACGAYLADVYRELFGLLRRAFDYVITTSDHGHSFGEHGVWGHGYGVHPEVTRVPLCVSRGTEGHTRIRETVSLLDVHRTLLNLGGREDATSRGSDLLESAPRGECLTEFHGLYPNRVETLLAAGFDDAEIRARDAERRGFAVGRGYYGFETPQGFVETGTGTGTGGGGGGGTADGPESPRERLASLVDDLRPVDAESESESESRSRSESESESESGSGSGSGSEDVPAGVRAHLEDLGYE